MEHFIAEAPLIIPSLLLLGGVSGILAGLLGIGGGIVLVPGLYHLFLYMGYEPSNLMHLAVGTSLAVIIPTGLSSARAHAKKGAVEFNIVRMIAAGLVIGVIAGTVIAWKISGEALTAIFAIALVVFAVLMNIPRAEKTGAFLSQPTASIGGFFVGLLSSLMGIGGATLNVPFLTLHGVPIHKAIGSSSAMGPLIAIPGTIGFIVVGWHVSNLPPLSFGYISLAAFLVIAPASALAAPFGAALAHRLNVKHMRLVFSFFLIVVALKMISGIWHG